ITESEGGAHAPVFHVTENIDMPMKLGVESSQEEAAASKEEQVLPVEDNEELRGVLVSQLRKYYQVIEAGQGDDGLSAAIKNQPDIIVSDVMMQIGRASCRERG